MDGRKNQDDKGARSMPSPEEILRLAKIERDKRPDEGRKGKRTKKDMGAIREYTWIELGLQGPLDVEEL
jgi:hypothetical protein